MNLKMHRYTALALIPIQLATSSYVLLTDYSFLKNRPSLYFESEYRQVGKAKFRTESVEGSHVKYADGFGSLYFSHPVSENNYLSWEAGYSAMKFDWKDNPRFKGDDYHIAVGSLGWVSTSIDRWRWVFTGSATVDTRSFNFGKDGVYYGFMWGRYAYSATTGIHIGWYGHYGMENGYVQPVIGVDSRIGEKWQLNAIYPIDLSLSYLMNPSWSLTLKYATFGRPYRHPWRIHGGIGKFKDGIFEVYASGAELDLNYNYKANFLAGIGGGWNFGGWILIKDRDNHHPKYYKYDDAAYGKVYLAATF
ncbi:MAG: hypothetical protein HYX48_05415 [Chlamydiales bacterium]|nr:hypothetical protein [Chlamydiales bacterium]